jgi:cytochrome c-type biogenesis protein CcmH/NrfG
MQRRFVLIAVALVGAAALGGCAALNTVTSEVATYGDWPAVRAPGRYAFERLPSQQAQPARQAELEAAAARALEAVGFTAAPSAAQADVIVQVGARIGRTDISP